jgi:hypothetical protein
VHFFSGTQNRKTEKNLSGKIHFFTTPKNRLFPHCPPQTGGKPRAQGHAQREADQSRCHSNGLKRTTREILIEQDNGDILHPESRTTQSEFRISMKNEIECIAFQNGTRE